MFMPWEAPNRRNPSTALCARGAARRLWNLAEEAWAEAETAFRGYGQPLEKVISFLYLGRLRTEMDDDWPAVISNIQKAERSWALLSRTPSREGHRWELPDNYPVFTVVMAIYHYVERIWRILVTPVFLYKIYYY